MRSMTKRMPVRTDAFNTEQLLAREADYATPPDILVGISQAAINKFLVAHFKNNPQFYDRGRHTGNPIYSLDVNDHGQIKTLKFYAVVAAPDSGAAVSIDLTQTPTDQQRFLAWWRAQHGAQSISQDTEVPPVIKISVPDVTLQIDLPKLDGGAGDEPNGIDFPFSIAASVFAQLGTSGPDTVLKLIDWDIEVTAVSDPLLPDDPRWGPTTPACDGELKRLRQFIANAFKLGANVALTQLSQSLVRTLPLPPINPVHGVSIVPRQLYADGASLVLTAAMNHQTIAAQVLESHQMEMSQFARETSRVDLAKIFSAAPGAHALREEYLRKEIPAYAAIATRHEQLRQRHLEYATHKLAAFAVVPTNDLFVMVGSSVFDILAHELLNVNKGDCTDWWKPIDVLLGYARGRACYWIRLMNGHGAVNGTDLSMGCSTDVGGKLDLQACVRIPCAPDQCTTWSPGFGLKGKLGITAHLSATGWDDNQALRLSLSFDDFPGFEVYGLPPVVGDVADAILNFVSSVALKSFFNALLSMFDFYLIQIQAKIPNANVSVEVHQLGVANDGGYLVATGTTTFK